MRPVVALVLALLALAPACSEETPPVVDDRPRGERCDDMQECGRVECAAELQALLDCIGSQCSDPGNPEREEVEIALAECLESNDCDSTTCDLVALQSDEAAAVCDDETDGDLYIKAKAAMLDGTRVAECQALE